MKKHMMKILAAAAALSIAAMPCMLPVTAADTTDSAVISTVSADTFTDILPYTYTGQWNSLVESGLWCCEEAVCALDMSAFYETAIANAGSHAAFLKALFGCAENETLTYQNSVFTVTADIPCLGDTLIDASGLRLSEQLLAIRNQYADTVDFSALDAVQNEVFESACTLTLKADMRKVGTTASIPLSFSAAVGNENFILLGENGILTYLKAELMKYTAATEAAMTEITGENADDACKEISALLDNICTRVDSVSGTSLPEEVITVSADTLAAALAQLEADYPAKAALIPSSAVSAASILENSWVSLLSQINSNIMPEGFTVNPDIYDMAEVFDSLTDVTLSLADGNAVISGTLEDTQTEEVLAYYAENPAELSELAALAEQNGDADATGLCDFTENCELLDTEKYVEVCIPLSVLTEGSGDFYYHIMRTYTFEIPETTETPTEESTEPTTEETTEEITEPTTEETTEESTEPMTEEATEESTEPTTEDATEESTEPTTEDATEESTEESSESDESAKDHCDGGKKPHHKHHNGHHERMRHRRRHKHDEFRRFFDGFRGMECNGFIPQLSLHDHKKLK